MSVNARRAKSRKTKSLPKIAVGPDHLAYQPRVCGAEILPHTRRRELHAYHNRLDRQRNPCCADALEVGVESGENRGWFEELGLHAWSTLGH